MCPGLSMVADVWSWRCDVTCFVFHILVFNSVKMEIRGEPPGMNCGVCVQRTLSWCSISGFVYINW